MIINRGGPRLGRFPAQPVVVLADDGLTVPGYATHTGVRVRAELARLITVAAAGYGMAAARLRGRRRRRSGHRRRRGRWRRQARAEPYPGRALLALLKYQGDHR